VDVTSLARLRRGRQLRSARLSRGRRCVSLLGEFDVNDGSARCGSEVRAASQEQKGVSVIGLRLFVVVGQRCIAQLPCHLNSGRCEPRATQLCVCVHRVVVVNFNGGRDCGSLEFSDEPQPTEGSFVL